MLILSCLMAAPSIHLLPLVAALFLLGLGWNFAYVAGSTLLADQLSPMERAKTQGFNDLLLNLASAASQIGSGVSGRTLSRLKGGKSRLPADLSDRLYSVASVYALAEDVFGTAERARLWLAEQQHGLGGRRPQELVATEFGRVQVRALLKRIEHGYLA